MSAERKRCGTATKRPLEKFKQHFGENFNHSISPLESFERRSWSEFAESRREVLFAEFVKKLLRLIKGCTLRILEFNFERNNLAIVVRPECFELFKTVLS